MIDKQITVINKNRFTIKQALTVIETLEALEAAKLSQAKASLAVRG